MQCQFEHTVEFAAGNSEALRALPETAGVFALFGHAATDQPYLSRTPNLRRRLQRLLTPDPKAPRRLDLSGRVARIEYTVTGSDFEAVLLLFRASAAHLGMETAERRLRLHTPFCIRLTVENAYPRAYVTNRISARSLAHTYGPFATRASAERFLDESLNLFKLRRCHEELSPDAAFPGCIYSEMKMCLAPCFKGCTDERYAEESRAVGDYLATHGSSLLNVLAASRDAASESLDFERASELHAAITRAQNTTHLADEIVRPLQQLTGVVVLPAAVEKSVGLFLLRGGLLAGPTFVASAEELPTALETLEAQHTAIAGKKFPLRLLTCHLALLKRWYYRGEKHRIGDIYFSLPDGNLPQKRIARAVNRILNPAAQASIIQPDTAAENTTPTTDTLAIE